MMLRKHGAILLALWVGLYAYACNPNESETHTATLGGKADQAGLPSEGMNWAQIEKRCQRPAEDEPIIYSDDFQWGISAEEMGESISSPSSMDPSNERPADPREDRPNTASRPPMDGGDSSLPRLSGKSRGASAVMTLCK